MINLSAENSFTLKKYWVDHYSDELVKLMIGEESIKFSFSDEACTKKIIFSDLRLLIEEKEENGFSYSFIGYDKIDYLQIQTKDLYRYVKGALVSIVLKNGYAIKLTFSDDEDICELQSFLSSKILGTSM